MGASLPFAALAFDQHGDPMNPQPAIVWSVEGGGSIDAQGVLTAPDATATVTVKAESGTVSGTEEIEVRDAVAFRYARVIAKSKPDNYINAGIYDISWHAGGGDYPAADMTANDAPAPLAATATYEKDPKTAVEPYTAFDGDKGAGLSVSGGNLPCTITVDLGTAAMPMPDAMTMITRTGSGREITAVACQVSIDGTTWYTLYDGEVKISGTKKVDFGIPVVPVGLDMSILSMARPVSSNARLVVSRSGVEIVNAQVGDNLTIHTALGRLVVRRSTTESGLLALPDLSKGIYFASLERRGKAVGRVSFVVR
jgi:hypothetical protein